MNVWQTGTSATPWTVAGIKVYNGENPYPGESGLGVNCTVDSCSLSWSPATDATGYNVYRSSTPNGVFNKLNSAEVATVQYSDSSLEANRSYFYKISAVLPGGESGLSPAAAGLTSGHRFGPNVYVMDPSMAMADIQNVADSIFAVQESNEFGEERHAILFKPGAYDGVNVKVGFYTQVSGLGRDPDDVSINGSVNANADWNNGNALVNFWRSSENMSITPPSGSSAQWAVAQAAPMRRMHIKGQLELFDFDPWWNAGLASGGYLGDSKVEGTIIPASQRAMVLAQ